MTVVSTKQHDAHVSQYPYQAVLVVRTAMIPTTPVLPTAATPVCRGRRRHFGNPDNFDNLSLKPKASIDNVGFPDNSVP